MRRPGVEEKQKKPLSQPSVIRTLQQHARWQQQRLQQRTSVMLPPYDSQQETQTELDKIASLTGVIIEQ